MNDFEYNYIIIGGSGFYEVAYNDLKSLPNVQYFKNYIEGIRNPLARFLIKFNFNLKVNRFISTPLRLITYPWLFPVKFNNSKPLCFLFFNLHFAIYNTSYIEFLKKKYPTAKFVLYMQDIVKSLSFYDIESYKDRFDIILSYDKGDSDRYGLVYFPTPYSKIDLKTLPAKEPIDIYFCGKAKQRIDEIMTVYRLCKQNNLKCKFFITGVPKDKQVQSDDIIYDEPITYLENLSYVSSCKCIVEIMQQGADGFTPRLWEAMFYGKHLLTNNEQLGLMYSEKDGIHYVKKTSSSLDWIDDKVSWSVDIIKTKSPFRLLQKIESLWK